MVKELGGKAGSTVTKSTRYLVVGADPGSKATRAEALGIEKINELQFIQLLDDTTRRMKGQV